jgi:hypothetical protein
MLPLVSSRRTECSLRHFCATRRRRNDGYKLIDAGTLNRASNDVVGPNVTGVLMNALARSLKVPVCVSWIDDGVAVPSPLSRKSCPETASALAGYAGIRTHVRAIQLARRRAKGMVDSVLCGEQQLAIA